MQFGINPRGQYVESMRSSLGTPPDVGYTMSTSYFFKRNSVNGLGTYLTKVYSWFQCGVNTVGDVQCALEFSKQFVAFVWGIKSFFPASLSHPWALCC